MGKWITRLLTLVLLGVFLFSAGRLLAIRLRYRRSEQVYSGLAEEVTSQAAAATSTPVQPDAAPTPDAEDDGRDEIPEEERVPVYVNFDALRAINEDIVGWIYCEDSVINYPVVYRGDNEYYLDHNIRHEVDPCGSIFADKSNHKGFVDSNVILYGHHMQNMSMFASLKYWLEQEYYEEHPVMWLLTPEGDYRVDLFSGYETAARSESYSIYYGPRPEFDEYLQTVAAQSKFTPHPVELDGFAKYVMLSTCAYSFNEARTVLHGKLTPVPSVGGVPNVGYKG